MIAPQLDDKCAEQPALRAMNDEEVFAFAAAHGQRLSVLRPYLACLRAGHRHPDQSRIQTMSPGTWPGWTAYTEPKTQVISDILDVAGTWAE